MSNTGEFYDHTTFPVTRSTGSSANMRAELDLIETGFNKLPPMTGNALRLVKVGSAATDLTVSSLYETTSNQLLYGTSASRSVGGTSGKLQVEAASTGTSVSIIRNSADNIGALLIGGKSRATSVGGVAAVTSGDELLQLAASGADGTNMTPVAAVIQFSVDGAVATGQVPGRIDFYTTAVGSGSPVSRMRLTNAGLLGVGGTPANRKIELHDATRAILRAQATQTTGTDALSGIEFWAWDGSSVSTGASINYSYSLQSIDPNTLSITNSRAGGITLWTSGTKRLTLDSGGDLILGGTTNTASSRLCVIAAEGEGQPASVNGDDIRLIRNSVAGATAAVSVIAGTTAVARYQLGDATAANRGVLAFNNSTGELYLAQSGTTRLSIDSSGLVTVASGGVLALPAGAAATPSLTPTGDADTGLWFPAANTVAISTAGSERARISSSGVLAVGTQSPASTPGIQVAGSTYTEVRLTRNVDSTSAHAFVVAKSRGTESAPVIVNNGDTIANILFVGYDGASYVQAASITSSCDGTPGVSDMPGRIAFNTSPDGASTPIERMRVTSTGDVVLTSSTGVAGYSAGAGGTVTQLTSKSTGVTLNRPSGQITMNGAALAAATAVSFTLTNSVIATTDVVYACIDSAATAGAYSVTVDAVGAGSCQISVRNNTAGSLSEAIVLNFVVLRAATA